MINYNTPIRNNVPQKLQYTFYDENQVIIDLTPYVSAIVEIKLQATPLVTVPATIGTPATNGQVSSTSPYTFVQTGTWSIQFVCTDNSGNKLYGEPLQVVVVPNIDDLASWELPTS